MFFHPVFGLCLSSEMELFRCHGESFGGPLLLVPYSTLKKQYRWAAAAEDGSVKNVNATSLFDKILH